MVCVIGAGGHTVVNTRRYGSRRSTRNVVVDPAEVGQLVSRTLVIGVSETGLGFADASKVIHALNAVSLGLGLGERRKQHAGEDTNDGNHNQQLDEGKSLTIIFHSLMSVGCVSLSVLNSSSLAVTRLTNLSTLKHSPCQMKNPCFLGGF